VISDNRYGLYTAKIPCVLITHQLQIQVPQSSIFQKWVNRINHQYITKFTTCFVPDYEVDKISGQLSNKTELTNITYIGNLSRFTPTAQPQPVYDLLVLLSGPEPQRSLLENLLLDQIQHTNIKTYVVRGKPGSLDNPIVSTNITIVNHLGSTELQTVMTSSAMIVARSGYSTIMDLIKLNRRAILIPTPGQTEQEYLASYLAEKNWFMTCDQQSILLKTLRDEYHAHAFSTFPAWPLEQYKIELQKILA
jgi:UDP-N-acetylglucosamine transferase subunit ALG13